MSKIQSSKCVNGRSGKCLRTNAREISSVPNECVMPIVVVYDFPQPLPRSRHGGYGIYDEMLTAHFINTLKDKILHDHRAISSREAKKNNFHYDDLRSCAPNISCFTYAGNSAFTAFVAIQLQLIYS